MVSLFLVPFIVSLAAPPQTAALEIVVPPPGETQEIVLDDGTRAVGRVEHLAGDRVTFRTTSGAVLEVNRSQVAEIVAVTGRVIDGTYWPTDPNPTRLLFAPTARSLKRGEAYLGVYEVYMPFVQVGVTDRLSVGGGALPFIGNDVAPPFWLTPKVQVVAGGRIEAAVGLLHIVNPGAGNVGIAYGVMTSGSDDDAVTIGAGYAYARGDDHRGGAPVVMIGGERRVSRRVKLMTENYVFGGDGGLVSGGVRFLGDRLSVDCGLAAPLGVGFFVVFPVVNFVWTFH